jgi:putative oxidoreductase
MKALFRQFSVALMILLFVYAAASKLMAFDLFRVQLGRQAFPGEFAGILLFALPATELLAAVLLMFRQTRFAGLLLSLTLLYFFTVYIVLVLFHFWNKVPCPCGGILSHMGWTVHLVFNCGFILLNLFAINTHLKERRSLAR